MTSANFARRLAWTVAGVSIAFVILGFALSLIYITRTGNVRPLISHQGLIPFITLSYALLGGLVTSRHPRNVIGWLYLTTAILYALLALVVGNTVYESLDQSIRLPWSDGFDWLGRWVWIPALVLPFSFALPFFPDGRLLSRRWRLLIGLTAVGLVGAFVSLALNPDPNASWGIPGPNPYGIPGAGSVMEPLLNVSGALLGFSMLMTLLAVGLRFRRARGTEREQLKWVVYTTVALFLLLGLTSALAPLFLSASATTELSIILTDLLILGIAASVSLAILRYRLYEIDVVINRTLVYGFLTLIVAGLYVLVVGGLGVMFQAAGNLALSLLGVGLVALVAQPVRERLQSAVNRLMYGERDDPYAVLSRLSQRLEDTLAPEAVLPTIVETAARALKVPYAVIEVNGEQSTVSRAEWKTNATVHSSLLTASLVFQSEIIGHLRVAPRAPDEAFSATDRRLLEDLARQAGAAAQAVRLTADLQHSREQLVTAREEERRRLRRDLHDGLGSQFAALHLRADTLRTLIQNNPPAAEAVAIELRDEIRAAVSDIRRLVYELRPPTLDELGLAGAMRALAAQRTSVNGLRVLIEAPEPLPPLPAAVEVAAYRIAQEALTNVVRHAHAHTCHIHLALADDLRLEIRDDGIGLPTQPRTGIGLRSMRERAAELGGTCRVETDTTGGTYVVTRLPLIREPNG